MAAGHFRRWAHPLRLAVSLWCIALVAVGVRVWLKPRANSVYPIFAHAGAGWLAGRDLYSETGPGLDVYRYSPLVAAAFAPLSCLSERAGNLLWRLVNAAAYLGALFWWARATFGGRAAPGSRPPWNRSQIGALFLLVLPLSVGNLNNGQSNALVLALVLATLAAVTERRWNLASACVAAACLFKVYPVAVGLLLTVLYPRRFGPRFAAALAVGAALPFLLQRPEYVAEQYAGWLRHMQGDDRQTWPLSTTYRDFRLLCRLYLTPLSALAYQAIQLAVAALIALLCFLHARRRDERETLSLLLSLACCWMTLFGSAAESATYLLLAPGLAALLVEAWVDPEPAGARLLLSASYGLLVAAQIANWFPFGNRFHSFGPQPLAALVLFGYLLSRCLRREVAAGPTAVELRAGVPPQRAA